MRSPARARRGAARARARRRWQRDRAPIRLGLGRAGRVGGRASSAPATSRAEVNAAASRRRPPRRPVHAVHHRDVRRRRRGEPRASRSSSAASSRSRKKPREDTPAADGKHVREWQLEVHRVGPRRFRDSRRSPSRSRSMARPGRCRPTPCGCASIGVLGDVVDDPKALRDAHRRATLDRAATGSGCAVAGAAGAAARRASRCRLVADAAPRGAARRCARLARARSRCRAARIDMTSESALAAAARDRASRACSTATTIARRATRRWSRSSATTSARAIASRRTT